MKMKKLYKFQCPNCYIFSGNVSEHREDAPNCCDGESMVSVEIPVMICPKCGCDYLLHETIDPETGEICCGGCLNAKG